MSDNIRNTRPLKGRVELFRGILDIGLEVIVLGVIEPSSKFKHPNVIYADELGAISDALQIHILNGALGVIGSPSGVTHLTYCTDTPTLLLDMPFPFCSYYPGSNMKALLKKLKHGNQFAGLAKYYAYEQQEIMSERIRNADGLPFSPLHNAGLELECNPDQAVLHAFKELLIETYSPQELKSLHLDQKSNLLIDFETMKKDKHEINKTLKKCKKKSDQWVYFEANHLSTANWFRY